MITELNIVSEEGYYDIAAWLIHEKKVDVNKPDKAGYTPLTSACISGKYFIVSWFLFVADFNAPDKWGSIPLIAASNAGHLNIVKLFVSTQRINVNLLNKKSRSALSAACRCAYQSVAMYLLEYLGDHLEPTISVADLRGNTPLHYAIWCDESD